MTTIYDPHHPLYLDEADTRNELARVYDLCHGCRSCTEFCPSFPTLFSYIDAHKDQDSGRMTPAQQDHVADECFQCKLCYVACPYIPELHERAIDFPRLMLRTHAMRRANGQVTVRDKITTAVMGHTDVVGRLATTAGVISNVFMSAKRGSLIRKVVEKTAGISSVRMLPPFAKQRFTIWFTRRPQIRFTKLQGDVAIFPTCLVEYANPRIGHDLVKVYEHNGISCSLSSSTSCCGAPYLHSGDMDTFTKIAARNVSELVKDVRAGKDIVVPQPTCSYILKKDYVDYVGGPDAMTVSEHTYDTAEYLMKVHNTEGKSLNTDFRGTILDSVTYHMPCHLRAQNIGLKSRDLMKLTGARIKVVQQCSGTDGMWGLRAKNAHLSMPIADKLGRLIAEASGDIVTGDCHLANIAISEQTGNQPVHPLQVIARAYGFIEEN